MLIEISDGFFTIKNEKFHDPPSLKKIEEILCRPRSKKPIVAAAKSTIHTFDEAGIWVYEQKGIVSQVSILFSKPYLDFYPKAPFRGRLMIKSVPIRTAEDAFQVENNDVWLDEWEAEGSATIVLEKIMCSITADPDTKGLDEIGFWFRKGKY